MTEEKTKYQVQAAIAIRMKAVVKASNKMKALRRLLFLIRDINQILDKDEVIDIDPSINVWVDEIGPAPKKRPAINSSKKRGGEQNG